MSVIIDEPQVLRRNADGTLLLGYKVAHGITTVADVIRAHPRDEMKALKRLRREMRLTLGTLRQMGAK